jgi:hypothetical protein
MQVEPPFSIADVLAGVVPVDLYLHLGEHAALQPFDLATLQEATFPGYLPALLIVSTRQECPNGYGYLEGAGTFNNSSDDQTYSIRSAWLTASNPQDGSATILLNVLPTLAVQFPPGGRKFTVRMGCFQQEEVTAPA